MKMRSLRMLLDFLPPKLRLRMPTLLLQLSVSLRMLLGFLAHDRDEVAIWAEFRSASGDAHDAIHVADELGKQQKVGVIMTGHLRLKWLKEDNNDRHATSRS